mmetsp:Transcript_40507/g.96008  ORF Transcript_40507/g.96008 Transcript_40507/m.96008 type:complete len:207 (-) Transcript_40507:23-643(-)
MHWYRRLLLDGVPPVAAPHGNLSHIVQPQHRVRMLMRDHQGVNMPLLDTGEESQHRRLERLPAVNDNVPVPARAPPLLLRILNLRGATVADHERGVPAIVLARGPVARSQTARHAFAVGVHHTRNHRGPCRRPRPQEHNLRDAQPPATGLSGSRREINIGRRRMGLAVQHAAEGAHGACSLGFRRPRRGGIAQLRGRRTGGWEEEP